MQDARDPKGARPPGDDEPIEVRCPTCDALVRVPRETAEREMAARCPKGHPIVLFGAI